MAVQGQSNLGRSYRSYRFPQRKGGRLSRRPVAGHRLGPLAGGISAFFLAMLAMGGVAVAAVFGYFAADLPAAHDLATMPIPLTTKIYDRSGEHLLYTLEDERRELVSLDAVPQRMQDATIAIEDKSFWTNPGVDIGGIDISEADAAKAEPIVVKAASTSLYAAHFTFRVREQLIRELGEKAAYRGGYTVFTTLDWNMQQLAEKEVRDHVDSLKGFNVNNAALITMDPTTGEILAYVGSYDYYGNTAKMQGDYDHAGIALRQPGSTFKLFT